MKRNPGFTRPLGAKGMATARIARAGARNASRKSPNSVVTKQPQVLIIGGGQGGIALGARLRQLNVPTIIIEKNERAGDLAQALQVALPARSGLVRPLRSTSTSRRTGRCSRQRTRSATGSRCTPR